MCHIDKRCALEELGYACSGEDLCFLFYPFNIRIDPRQLFPLKSLQPNPKQLVKLLTLHLMYPMSDTLNHNDLI